MDIDIDLKTTFDPCDYFNVTRASMVKDGALIKHPAGVYFQNTPSDPITGLSAIPYNDAEQLGFFKVDFLHLSVLDVFETKDEINTLLELPPNWSLLTNPRVVRHLFQLKNNFELLYDIKPTSIEELADCVAMIRPLKRNLRYKYRDNVAETRKLLYRREPSDKTSFKKGHAIAYATTIVLQLHLIEAGIIDINTDS